MICGRLPHLYEWSQDDGTCNACPILASAWDRYRGLFYVIITICGIVAAVWAGLQLLVRLRGGTLVGGAVRMIDLGVWGLLSAQVRSASVVLCRQLAECPICRS